MAGLGELLGSIKTGGGLGGGGFMGSIIYILVGTVVLFFCGFGLWWFLYRRKRWNISVEFRIPRNVRQVRQRDGTLKVVGTINKEWGKGFYSTSGVVMVKRKGKKAVAMKPFDIKRFLSDGNILTVVQVGIEDYRPILDDSYIELVDDKTGEEAALINARIDTSEGKAWRSSYERDRKNTYSIMNWLQEHGTLVGMGLIIMMVLVGFGILWTRLPKICG